MRLFGTIEKVEELEDGTLKVSGVASSEAVDSDGEVIKASAMAAAIPDYMKFGALREMHQPLAAGTALACEVQEDGRTYLEALVVDPVACKKVKTGTYKGFSIGGKVTKRTKNIIEGIRLTEISLVDRPANPEAVFSLAKMEDGMEAEQTKAGEEPDASDTKKAEALDTLKKYAGEEINDSGVALNALDAVFYLLCKEMGEDGEDPAQVEALQAAVANLKRFIASEIQETNLPPQPGEMIAMAEPTGDLEKKLSGPKQKALQDAHDQLSALHKSMGDCMDKMAGIWKDDGVSMAEATGDLGKAEALEDELTKAHQERDGAIQKADVLEKRVKELEAKIAEKPLKVVPIEKAADATTITKADDEIPADPVAAMRKVHASGGRPITLTNHNRLGY